MSQVGFYFNQSICSGCNACLVACKDKNDLLPGIQYRRVYEFTEGGFVQQGDAYVPSVRSCYASISCNHCTEPKCVAGCPTGAMHKREEDGVVVVDHGRCVGCKYCTWNCPYGAPQYNEELGKMTKCDTCLDLREKGERPACVAACPISALDFGDIEELRKKYGNIATFDKFPSDKITKPNLVITPHSCTK